jgi:hypothetical protein
MPVVRRQAHTETIVAGTRTASATDTGRDARPPIRIRATAPPPAAKSAAVGFCDQADLTLQFRRFL